MCLGTLGGQAATERPEYPVEAKKSEEKEVWIKARLVQHNDCGVTSVRVRQHGHLFVIGVDKSDLHELTVSSRLDQLK